jgi:class 3 adenylate cyclase
MSRGDQMVAVCDILGFSDLVERHSLDDVVDHAYGWFRKALHFSVHRGEFPSAVPPREAFGTHPALGVAWFSDTILLYTKSDDDEAIRQLVMSAGWLIFATMIEGTTRIRAGISYGEAFIDPENSIYVGKAIVEAARLERNQQWAGGALTEHAERRVPAAARTGQFADWWITRYEVPLKGGSSLRTLVVKWTLGSHLPDWKMPWDASNTDPPASEWQRRPDVCEKFVNTKRFHDVTCSRCLRAP